MCGVPLVDVESSNSSVYQCVHFGPDKSEQKQRGGSTVCAESDKKEEERTCPVYFHSDGTSGVSASSVNRYQMNQGVLPWNKKNLSYRQRSHPPGSGMELQGQLKSGKN